MTLKLNGSSSGSVSIDAPASTTGGADLTYTLPNATTGGIIRTTTTPGAVLQVVSVAKTDSFSTSSTSAVDVTGLTLNITPSSASNKVLVFFSAWASVAGDQHGVHVELHRDSTKIADNYNQYPSVQSQTGGTVFNQLLDSPNTTSAVTYKVKIKTDDASRTARIGAGSNDGTTNIPDSVITLMEIAG